MAGLMQQKQRPGGGPQPGGPAPQGPRGTPPAPQSPGGAGPGAAPEAGAEAMAPEGEAVSPEEQAAYDRFVTNGMTLIYSDNALPKVLDTLAGDGNPIEGLANATAMVALRLDESARQSEIEVPGPVKFHGSVELLEQMAELGEAAGIHEYSPEDLESATFMALDLYRESQSEQGQLPKEELEQDMQQVLEAEEQGKIEQVLPGLSEYAEISRQREGKEQGPGPGPGEGAPPAGGGGGAPQGPPRRA